MSWFNRLRKWWFWHGPHGWHPKPRLLGVDPAEQGGDKQYVSFYFPAHGITVHHGDPGYADCCRAMGWEPPVQCKEQQRRAMSDTETRQVGQQ